MKKVILTLYAIIFVSTIIKAQVYPKTVGLRAHVGNYGVGPEISYQHGLGDANRAEVGLALGSDNSFTRFGLTGSYHWVVSAEDIKEGFSWYAGPAAQVWLYSFSRVIVGKESGIGGAVGAHAGVEYDFNEVIDLPFTASLDTRPMFNFVSYYSGFEFAVGLSIRYTF